MPDLAAHHNVYETCLRLLVQAGWDLALEVGAYDDDDHLTRSWRASKDGWELVADDPIQLLGLAAVHRAVQPAVHEPYWWRVDGASVFARLEDKALRDAFWRLHAEAPERWCIAVRRNLTRVNGTVSAADALGIPAEDVDRARMSLHEIEGR